MADVASLDPRVGARRIVHEHQAAVLPAAQETWDSLQTRVSTLGIQERREVGYVIPRFDALVTVGGQEAMVPFSGCAYYGRGAEALPQLIDEVLKLSKLAKLGVPVLASARTYLMQQIADGIQRYEFTADHPAVSASPVIVRRPPNVINIDDVEVAVRRIGFRAARQHFNDLSDGSGGFVAAIYRYRWARDMATIIDSINHSKAQ